MIMKLIVLLFCFILFACSSVNNKSISSLGDSSEGHISSGEGSPLIYYREGNIVVIKSCHNSSQFDINNPKIAREKCQGKENRVTAEYFKELLTKLIAEKAAEKTKKETAAAASAGAGGGPKPNGPVPGGKSAVEKLQEAQIEKQLEFIEAYNQDPSAIKELRETNVKGVFNQKLKNHLDKTLDSLIDNSALARKNATNDQDNILKEVLKELDPNRKKPCGLRGNLQERMEHCASMPGASFGNWKLVTRTKNFSEIWRENNSGLVWGQVLNEQYDHIDAVGQCSISREENGELDPSEFRLPTISELMDSQLSSGMNPLFQKEFRFWSSTSDGAEVWVYDGSSGKKELVARSKITKSKDGTEFNALVKLHARCVAKLK